MHDDGTMLYFPLPLRGGSGWSVNDSAKIKRTPL